MPRRWSGSAAVPQEVLSDTYHQQLVAFARSLGPKTTQGPDGVSKSVCQGLAPGAGSEGGALRAVNPDLTGLVRRSTDEGTRSLRRSPEPTLNRGAA